MHFSNILHFFSPAAGKIEMTLCPLLVGVNRKQTNGYIFGPGSFWRRAEIETKEKKEFDINEYEESLMEW